VAPPPLPPWASRLVVEGAVDDDQVQQLADRALQDGHELDRLLVNAGLVPEETVALSMALEFGVSYVDPRSFDINLTNCELLPEHLAKTQRIFPLFILGNIVTLGMADPGNLAVIDQVRLRANCEVESCLCPPSVIEALIDRAYSADGLSPSLAPHEQARRQEEDQSASSLGANKTVRVVNSLLEKAVRAGASDVHIEPERDMTRVRVRVDGILHELTTLSLDSHAPIVSRIKVQSKLDIAEARKPQDGQFSIRVPQGTVDVRVSTIPTVYGENVVMRLLLSGDTITSLDDLAIPTAALERLHESLDNPHGMILVTGPTGSGKTTTLYAALERLNTVERNVVTVEDPVEKRVPMLRQTSINPKAGVTFAAGMRSLLRQDPDVIMIGEIRDQETAEIAIQAALTGHLVLSTLHTNTAAGAIVRLCEMGVPPFMITSSLQAVISQRLARRVCEGCKEPAPANVDLARALGWTKTETLEQMVGVGCTRCLQTGYKGRVGLYEMLCLNSELRRVLLREDSRDAVESQAERALVSTLRQDGLHKVQTGHTTVEELARVVGVRSRAPAESPEVSP